MYAGSDESSGEYDRPLRIMYQNENETARDPEIRGSGCEWS